MAELSSGVIILLYVRVQRLVWRIANPLSKPLQRRFGYNLLFSAAGYRLENLGQATNKRRFENALRVRVQSFAFFAGWLFRPLSVIMLLLVTVQGQVRTVSSTGFAMVVSRAGEVRFHPVFLVWQRSMEHD